MNNMLIHSNQRRSDPDIPKHTFLLGYSDNDGLPVIGGLQRNNKFMFVSDSESLLFTAINNSIARNKDIGFVIITTRHNYWMDMDLPNAYVYPPQMLGDILVQMEDEIELSDGHDVVLIIDGVKFEKEELPRLFDLKMFALFWWTDNKELSNKVSSIFPNLENKYKVVYSESGGKCAVRKTSQWLYFSLA